MSLNRWRWSVIAVLPTLALGVSRSVVHRWRLSRKPLETALETVTNSSGIPTVAA
jgi:hypothetical protein